jgi:hypothetical protein
VFSLVSLACGAGFQLVLSVDTDTTGTMGMLLAMLLAVWIVSGVVAWIVGVVLALRAGSLLWLVIAILPFPPLNSLVTAMFCPPAAAKRT